MVLNPCEKNAKFPFPKLSPKLLSPRTIRLYLSTIKSYSRKPFDFPKHNSDLSFLPVSISTLDRFRLLSAIRSPMEKKEKKAKGEPLVGRIEHIITPPLLADIPIKFGISPRQRRDATHPSVAIHPYRFRNDSKFVTGSIFGRRKQAAGWLQDVCRVYIFRLPPAALFVARSVIIDAVHWITQLTVYY